jgi:hypothetical protein
MSSHADAALIAVGTWIRSKTIVNSYDEAVAGIVCLITHSESLDAETGEITARLLFTVRDCNDVDPLRVRTLPADDIDPADAYPASTYDVARLVRRVCFEVGKAKSRKTRAARELTDHELTALLDALRVLAAVS